MPAQEEGPKEVVTALASIFAGLAEFFGMFDMSFFVSGAACLGAIVFALSGTPELNTEKANNVIGFIVLLTACYVLGLLMFMIGRTVRTRWAAARKKPTETATNTQFDKCAKAYGLRATDLPNIGDSLGADSMYSLGWATLRQLPECQPSLRFINKYWVMAATYDGVAAASWAWMAAIYTRNAKGHWDHGVWLLAGAMGTLLVVSLGCLYRAKQYEVHQERELAATLAIVLTRKMVRTPAAEAISGS